MGTERNDSRRRAGRWLAAGLLGLAIALTFRPALDNGFVSFDDNIYVTENPVVRRGLEAGSLRWAFTSTYASNWHPLTWLSHLADVSLFGMDPRGHHLTSVLLHLLNGLLVLRLGLVLTGSLGAAIAAAALFALHPLRVESVAWVAERKDVLAALWFLAGALAYAGYVRRPGPLRYLGVVACHGLGLLAKPMAVTFPVVLLLLDWWPLGRLGVRRGASAASPARILGEKAPLLLMSAAVSAVTVLVQRQVAQEVTERFALADRVGNSIVSLLQYWAKTLWPARLAHFYPHPGAALPGLAVALAAAAVVLVTVAAWRVRRRAPWPGFAWAWFIVTVVPVIGIVHVGAAAMADRYTYLPFVGPVLALGAAVAALARALPRAAPALAACCVAAALAAAVLAHRQTAVWRDDWTLATHAVAVTERNWIALNDIGLVLLRQGRPREAIAPLAESVRHRPDWHGSRHNLGVALREVRRFPEAVEQLDAALRIVPEYWPARLARAEALGRWGAELADAGRSGEALARLDQAIAGNPGNPDYRYNRGRLLLDTGDLAGAREELGRVVALAPRHALGLAALGEVLESAGDPAGAGRLYGRALEIDPALDAARRGLDRLARGPRPRGAGGATPPSP